jgi:hypothetical protein
MLALLQQQLLLGGRKGKKNRKESCYTQRTILPVQTISLLFSSLLLRFARKGMVRRTGGSLQEPKHKQEAAAAATSAQLGKKGTHSPLPLPLHPMEADTQDLCCHLKEKKIKWKPPQTW